MNIMVCLFVTQESEPVYSYSVITVESSSAVSWIHHRMPVSCNDCCHVCSYVVLWAV